MAPESQANTITTSTITPNLDDPRRASPADDHTATSRTPSKQIKSTAGPKTMPKDRACPYCHQMFTSSSLGRHLDQYITKKQPDGIHNVEEIKAMRSRITRRHPRSSTGKSSRGSEAPGPDGGSSDEEDEEEPDDDEKEEEKHRQKSLTPEPQQPEHNNGTTSHKRKSVTSAPRQAPAPTASQSPPKTVLPPTNLQQARAAARNSVSRFGALPWEATGMIGTYHDSRAPSKPTIAGNGLSNVVDIPPTIEAIQARQYVSTPVSTTTVHAPSAASDAGQTQTKSMDWTEMAHFKAVELALKELLDNVKAASLSVRPKSTPFAFDLRSQTFPALCLQLLPTPPTLFATQVLPSPDSYTLDPPGFLQAELAKRQIRQLVVQWRDDALAENPQDVREVHNAAYEHEKRAFEHLEIALNQWSQISELQRHQDWKLELMRALSRESTKREEVEATNLCLQQEVNRLSVQIDRLSALKWPREFATAPPSSTFLSRNTMRDIQKGTASIMTSGPEEWRREDPEDRWDFDNIVSKWRKVVMHTGPGRKFPNSPLPVEGTEGLMLPASELMNSPGAAEAVGIPSATSRPGSSLKTNGTVNGNRNGPTNPPPPSTTTPTTTVTGPPQNKKRKTASTSTKAQPKSTAHLSPCASDGNSPSMSGNTTANKQPTSAAAARSRGTKRKQGSGGGVGASSANGVESDVDGSSGVAGGGGIGTGLASSGRVVAA